MTWVLLLRILRLILIYFSIIVINSYCSGHIDKGLGEVCLVSLKVSNHPKGNSSISDLVKCLLWQQMFPIWISLLRIYLTLFLRRLPEMSSKTERQKWLDIWTLGSMQNIFDYLLSRLLSYREDSEANSR
jgi:hypothetical protein